MTTTNDIEGLQQRHAGFHHRRQLPGKQGDILFGDLAATTETLLADLGDDDALPAQSGIDHGFTGGSLLAANDLPGLVLAHPQVGKLLDFGCPF